MLHGIKCPETQLWVIPLNYMNNLKQNNDTIHQANNVHTIKTQEELVTYIHQCLFFTPCD